MQHQKTESSVRLADEFAIRSGRGILFVDSQGLGDVVQSLPLLRAVCHWADGRWPVQALFATTDHYDLVREEHLNVKPLFVSSVPRTTRSVLGLWTKLIKKTDLIVCAPEMSATKLVLLKYATGARYAIGEASGPCAHFLRHSVEASWTRPWAETQDAIASALAIPTPLEAPCVHLTTHEINWADSVLAEANVYPNSCILGIQCSSVVPQKCWPAEYFGQVVREVQRRCTGMCVISFGNTMERSRADQTRRMAGDLPWLEGAGNWTIRQTLAMLSRCSVFLSGDTGLMHMAAAVGTRTVSVFGPTSAARRAPSHNRGVAICPDTSCHPCFQGAWTPCACIRSIPPARVIASVDECLAEKACPRRAWEPVDLEPVERGEL